MSCPKCGNDSPADWILCEECMPASNTPSAKKTAHTRKIPLDLKRRKPKKDFIKLTLVSTALLAILLVFGYLQLEIYTIPPIDPVPEGRTLIVWRAGDINEPFFNSPDAAMNSTNPDDRDFMKIVPTSRTLIELPYIEYFYLQSPTGGSQGI